jgi:SAM-dependent methyltransferase
MTEPFEPASFRDRHSRVFQRGSRIYRALSARGLGDWESLASTKFFREFSERGALVATRRAEDERALIAPMGDEWAAALEHDRVPFISYPYEWTFSMLKDAALLQLDLLLAALDEGMILKDASAYNLQFRGASPVFIDIGSFITLDPGEPWPGYRQFCQLFLYPLMLQAYKDIPFQPWLRGSLEGIDPRDANAMMSARDLLRSGVLAHIRLQAGAQQRFAATSRDVRADLRKAGFDVRLIKANVAGLRKLVGGLEWRQQSSTWADYAGDNSYDAANAERKAAFVRAAAADRPRHLVWDIGANTGTFSRIASEHADYVVSIDADVLAVERHYQALKQAGATRILPLIGNVADPAPALGWRGLERLPLEKRGRPDLVLCLALIHHVVITANVPLHEFVDWLAGLGGDLVIEFVTKDDAMVKTLLRNKDDQYTDYEQAHFEARLGARFEILRQETIQSGTRTLYFARPRA